MVPQGCMSFQKNQPPGSELATLPITAVLIQDIQLLQFGPPASRTDRPPVQA